jgi:hypothetical protein
MAKRPIIAVAVLLLLAQGAGANFVNVETGARAMGMGGAFVAVADDITALYWNPAGLATLESFQVFGMRTDVYGVDGLTEDSAMAAYGTGRMGAGLGWMRTGAEDLYHEDTVLLGYGLLTPIEGLQAGATIKRFSIDAPGYDYYNDPAFDTGGDAAFAADLGCLYRHGKWTVGAAARNLGEPKLQLIDTTDEPDAVYSELRVGGTYLFREVMLLSAEWRVPRRAPEYFEDRNALNLGTEIWFYDAFALRTGLNRDRITAGLGIKGDHFGIDVALLSERRIGSLYRLSVILKW